MFHSHLHHPGQIEAGAMVNPVDKSSGLKKKKVLLKDVAVATQCQRQNTSHAPVCFKANVDEEGATYIQETYLLHPSSCFLLKPDASFFLFSFSENHLVSTRYHSGAYSTSISHLVSFYSILNQSFSSLLSSNHTIFP